MITVSGNALQPGKTSSGNVGAAVVYGTTMPGWTAGAHTVVTYGIALRSGVGGRGEKKMYGAGVQMMLSLRDRRWPWGRKAP